MMKRWKYRTAKILIAVQFFYRFGSSRKQKQKPLEAEVLNFRVLMDYLNQENFRKLKRAVSLNVYQRNILVISRKYNNTRNTISFSVSKISFFF